LVDRSKRNIRNSLDLASAEISAIVVHAGSFGADPRKTSTSYFVSFNRENFRVAGAPVILDFAVVGNEGFAVSFRHLFNFIAWGLLATGPAAFEITVAVNAIVVQTGKDEIVAQMGIGHLYDPCFRRRRSSLLMRSELDISLLQWAKITNVNDSGRRLNLLERRLVESLATVVIPFDDCVFFVSSLHRAQFSSRLSEVAQTHDSISGSQLLASGRGLGERWSPGTI
jgi:hypothetical protein